MFLPYILISPQAVDGVDYPYLLSAYLEAYALNRVGQRYMGKWDPVRFERTTRDVNSIAAMIEVIEGRGSPNGGTYLSLRHLPRNVLDFGMRSWMPTNISNYKYGGFDMHAFLGDLSENTVETAPACHFWNGGIHIDGNCRTTVDGLWAAGEGSALIHGANRLSGNALTMTQVFGPRAGADAAAYAKANDHAELEADQVATLRAKIYQFLGRKGADPIQLRTRLRRLAHMNAGPVREDQVTLERALAEVAVMQGEWSELGTQTDTPVYNQEWIECLQIENMLQCLQLVLQASLLRTESRGAATARLPRDQQS